MVRQLNTEDIQTIDAAHHVNIEAILLVGLAFGVSQSKLSTSEMSQSLNM
jgi:hypothetical protein